MTKENQLLCQYAHDHNESAFAELVNRHLNLVYSTAFRRLQDVELAKDVTQVVFAELAKQGTYGLTSEERAAIEESKAQARRPPSTDA